MRIQHNIMAMNAYRNYTNNVSAMKKNLERLSSGYKINRAGDDAAGLAISEKMRAQITGLETAQKNAKDGISLVQTAEGALTEVHDMLNRMVTLATQSANGTYDNETDRAQLQKELDQLRTEIDRIADSSNFNGIKLLDGNLSKDYLATTEGIQTQQVDYANGIDCAVGEGGGSFGTYSFSIDTLFGVGDKIEIGVDTGSASTITVQFGGTSNGTTTVGFTGDTLEEQVKNIRAGLIANGTISSNFEVTSDGNTITLTNRTEGDLGTDNAAKITSIKATDKMTKKDTATWKATDGTDLTGAKVEFKKLFDSTGTAASASTGSLATDLGDTLTFEFTIGGKVYKANIEITEDMATNDTKVNTENIKKALEAAKFEDSTDTTGSNEERLCVGDLFTIAANATNVGDLDFTAKAGIAQNVTVGKVYTDNANGSHPAVSGLAGAPTTGSGSGAKQKYEIKLDTTNGATNFTVGDKLNISGYLSDGRSFEVTLEAGKDFEIQSAYNATVSKITDALKNGTDKDGNDLFVTVKGGGKETLVNAKDIFDSTTGDFTVSDTTGTLKIESNTLGAAGGTGIASITSVGLEAAEAVSVTANLNPGKVKSTADSTITFSDGVQYGSTITVGDNTYELVRSKDELSSQRNTAVVISDLSDTSAIATAMQKAIDEKDGASGNNIYTVTANKNVVTISSKDVGSTVPAPTVAAAKDISTELNFTLDPDKVISGSYVKINGQDYQFVEDRSKADAGKTAVVVNFKGADAKYLGDALANVASGKNNASVTVDDTGKVTVKSINEVDGELPVPTASFHDGKGGLTLQIGDTADDYNQLNVSISDMHCVTMGIANMSIADQDSAKAAIDTIRSAINYVSDVRGTLGATQNRLDHTINNLSVMQENIQDAESTIRDTDVAAEMMEYTKNNILIQSAQAMLAQANQVPQGVLQLLQ